MEYRSRSLRLDDEVWEAIQKLPISANQFLRRLLSADGVFETEVDPQPRKKQTRRERMLAELRASDPVGADREDVELGNFELPRGSVATSIRSDVTAAHRDLNRPAEASVADWRKGRKPLLKPSERKK